ncbi:MAG: hypothetical protein ACLSGS_06000 [Adlercreutzia sp.]
MAKPWLALACLAGIALIACTSMAYNVDTVPPGYRIHAGEPRLAALLAGPVLGLLFLELAQCGRARSSARSSYWRRSRSWRGPSCPHCTRRAFRHREQRVRSQHARAFLSCFIGAHLIVGAIALAIAGLSMKRVQSRRTTLALRATASLLALAAVFVTRIVFYHLHMTVGF